MLINCGVCRRLKKHYARGLCLQCYKKNYAAGKHDQYSFEQMQQVKQTGPSHIDGCDHGVNKCFICRDQVIRARGLCSDCYKKVKRDGKIDDYEVNFFRTTEELELWAALQGMEQKMCEGWTIPEKRA